MTDQEIIKQLRNGTMRDSSKAIRMVYKEGYPLTESLIVKNSGTKNDAEDIFQEAMVVFYKKVKHPDFSLNSKISTYLFAVSRNLWLKKLRDNRVSSTGQVVEDLHLDAGIDIQLNMEYTEEQKMIGELMMETGNKCYELLKAYYFEKQRMKKIAELLEYASEQVAKNQKVRCMKKIRIVLDRKPSYLKCLSYK